MHCSYIKCKCIAVDFLSHSLCGLCYRHWRCQSSHHTETGKKLIFLSHLMNICLGRQALLRVWSPKLNIQVKDSQYRWRSRRLLTQTTVLDKQGAQCCSSCPFKRGFIKAGQTHAGSAGGHKQGTCCWDQLLTWHFPLLVRPSIRRKQK